MDGIVTGFVELKVKKFNLIPIGLCCQQRGHITLDFSKGIVLDQKADLLS